MWAQDDLTPCMLGIRVGIEDIWASLKMVSERVSWPDRDWGKTLPYTGCEVKQGKGWKNEWIVDRWMVGMDGRKNDGRGNE